MLLVMKNWIKQSDISILICVFLLLLVKVITYFTDGNRLSFIVEPWLLGAILGLFIYKYPKINFIHKIFILLVLLGSIFGLYGVTFQGIKLNSIAYCLAYLCLIFDVLHGIKKVKINLFIGIYFLVVFLVNSYFLFKLYDIFKETILNNLELFFVVVRMTSLLVFALLSFTLYFSSESKNTILLLFISISLVFSDILFLINEYYIFTMAFDVVSKFLYGLTLYCFYRYIKNLSSGKVENNFSGLLT